MKNFNDKWQPEIKQKAIELKKKKVNGDRDFKNLKAVSFLNEGRS